MKVIPGPDGWPEGYEYTAGRQSIRFMDEVLPGVRPILHTRLFHPVNDHYGMSPIEAAGVAIDIHNEAAKWNKALHFLLVPGDSPAGSRPPGTSKIDGRAVRALKERTRGELPEHEERRPADAARRRARLEAVVARPQGHGLHRGEEHSLIAPCDSPSSSRPQGAE